MFEIIPVAGGGPAGAFQGRAGSALRRMAEATAALLAAERGRLALWLPVALGIGVLTYFGLREEPAAAWRWLPLPLVALALWLAPRRPHSAWIVGLAAAMALGFAAASWHGARQPPLLNLPNRAVVLSGVVQAVDLLPEGRRVTLSEVRLTPEDESPLPRLVRVRLRTEDPARPAPGDRLSVRALLRPPAPPAHPGAWDFQRAAFFSGLGASGFAIARAEVTPPAEDGAAAPPPLLATLRSTIETRVTAALPGPAGAVAAALLTGGQSAIPAADLTAMRDSGLAHLLSVSGLHIAIVMGLAFAVARLLAAAWPWLCLRVSTKAVASVAALAAGGFYMLLTGAQVPMQRSFAMAALVTLGVLLGRRALSLRVLGFAAVAVMLVQPAQLLGASFQMSFAAVLVLIAGWEAARPRLAAWRAGGGWRRRAALGFAGVVATSIMAGAATTPFGLHHFGRLQLYGVAANAVAVPLTSMLVMPAGMAALALMPLGLEGLALAPMGWGCEAVLAVARLVAAWPGAARSATPLPAWGLAATAFGMLWLCLWRTRWRLLGLPVIAFGLASPLLHRPPDLLVSADARLIAVRTEAGGVFVQRASGASNLVREIWLRGWAETEAAPLPREAGEAAEGAVRCTQGACTLRPRRDPEAPAAVLLRGAPPSEACGRAAVVVSAEPVRGRCAGSAVVDRFAVWRNGPHAVWLEPGEAPRVLSDRAWRGARPWVPPPPRPRAAPAGRGGGAAEPPAALDEGGPSPAAPAEP